MKRGNNMEPVQVILVGYVPYKFNDAEGKEVKGCTCWFLEQTAQYDDYGQGFIPKKVTLPYDYKDQLQGIKFPYLAEPVLATRFTSKGAKTVVSEFKLAVPVQFVIDKVTNK